MNPQPGRLHYGLWRPRLRVRASSRCQSIHLQETGIHGSKTRKFHLFNHGSRRETLSMNSPENDAIEAVTRRRFLQSSSVAGLAMLGGLSLENAVHAAGSDTLKIALIGCGGRGTGAANQVLNTGNVKLVAIADVSQSQIDKSLNQLQRRHPKKVDVPQERQFKTLEGYKQAISTADVVLLTAALEGFRR